MVRGASGVKWKISFGVRVKSAFGCSAEKVPQGDFQVQLSIDLFFEMVVSSEAYNSKALLNFCVQVVPVKDIHALQSGQ